MAYYRAGALDVLMAEVNALWPHRDKTSDGWIGDTSHQARPSDHNPDWSAGGIVRAQDIDEDLVAGLTATGEAMPLVNAIISDIRTRYVIYEGRIWTRENGWQPYNGVNAHRHHVHVSVRSVNGYDRDRSPWNLAARMSNTISGGGSVTIPNIPGAPAPITPEDDMQADEREALFQIRDVLGARGGLNTPADDSVLGRVRNLDRQVTGANGFRGSVAEKVNGLAGGLPAIAGNVLALTAREAAQTELIRQLGEGGDVDYDRIDRNTRAAVADGVAEVVAAIEGGIEADVTVTVNTPTTKG